MIVEMVVLNNSLPEVTTEGFDFKIDFWTVVIRLTPVEAASLCVNILAYNKIKECVFKSLK